jgi:hypothetical protein
MTRDEIQTEVVKNIDNRSDVLDSDLVRWINHAYHHLTHPAIHKFEDLAVTYDLPLVSGQASYDLSSATLGYRVLAIRLASFIEAAPGSIVDLTRRRRLKPQAVQIYDSQVHPQTSQPSNYVLGEAQSIIISHTPNVTYTVRLRLFREAASLSLGTSVTVLPEYFDEVLVCGAQALTEFKLGYRDRALETFQLYNSYINDAAPKDVLEGINWDIEATLVNPPIMGISNG